MQIFGVILGIAFLGMGIVQTLATIDGISVWLGWNGLLAGFLAFILGYFPVIGSICGVAGAHYAWGWGLLPSIALFFWYIPLAIVFFMVTSFRDFSEKRKQAQENERLADTRQTKKAGQGFVNRFINGDIRLPIMFWVYGITVSFSLKALVKLKEVENFFVYIYIHYDLIGVKIVSLAYDVILILYTILFCIGLWRSADNYTGRPLWATAAKFFAVLWMLSLVIIVADIISIILMKAPGSAG